MKPENSPSVTNVSELSNGGSVQSVVGPSHPQDGREWECQCARCGSTIDWESCSACGGEGITGPGELYEQDPLWYDMDDYEVCHQCGGESSYACCISTEEYCTANPMPGRENTPRHTVEWFTLERPNEKLIHPARARGWSVR